MIVDGFLQYKICPNCVIRFHWISNVWNFHFLSKKFYCTLKFCQFPSKNFVIPKIFIVSNMYLTSYKTLRFCTASCFQVRVFVSHHDIIDIQHARSYFIGREGAFWPPNPQHPFQKFGFRKWNFGINIFRRFKPKSSQKFWVLLTTTKTLK